MEIVINGCFGGFCLSYEAIKAIMKRKGMECYGYAQERDDNTFDINYTRIDSAGRSELFYCFPEDLGDVVSSDDMSEAMNTKTYYSAYSFTDDDNDRTDPDLVAVVKELGKSAGGSCSCLYVVEIPDDVNWYISDYDGNETVEEMHRSWS